MLEGLTNSFQNVFRRLSGKAKISARNIEQAVKDVKFALLQSDVHYDVVKNFISRIREKSLGEKVIKGVNPDQAFIKIVNDELTSFLGPVDHTLPKADPPPSIIMLVGLQGSGKTTTSAKLGKLLKKQDKKVLLIAADLARPAAIDQLITLGEENEIDVHADKEAKSAIAVAKDGLNKAKDGFYDVVILDTQGRLHVDEALMNELSEMKKLVKPHHTYLVLDAMTGQDAVNSAQQFMKDIKIDGAILTKLDGDAKGGAVLSVKFVTGVPIKFVGIGESIDALDEFHPERMSSRILGFGDVVSLVEKAQQNIKQEEAEKLKDRMMKGEYNFNDLKEQLGMITKMGNLKDLVAMIPGGAKIAEDDRFDPTEIFKYDTIINSMTKMERANPEIVRNRSRIQRIAKGSGVPYHDVEKLIKSFSEMKHVMGKLKKGPKMLGKLMGKFMS